MVGLVRAQHVENQVCRECYLTTGFFLSRELPFNEAANHRTISEGALHQAGLVQPCFQIIAEHVAGKQIFQSQSALVDH